jgi:hypothetical protein
MMISGLMAATAFQLFAVGSQSDIRDAAAMASKCGIHAKAGRLRANSALYLEAGALKHFESPELQCFFDKLLAHKFSADFGFIGNDTAPTKP